MTFGSVDNARTGDVWIPDYDLGVVKSLGAVLSEKGDYYSVKNIRNVNPPPDASGATMEGVPVYFADSDEAVDTKVMPSFIVRRDGIIWATNRWSLGGWQYNVPAPGAKPIQIIHPISGRVMAEGWDKYEKKDQAFPVDLLYSIQIRARYRNKLGGGSLWMLRHLMRTVAQPYTRISVMDSLGDTRYYDAFTESQSAQDTIPDITGKEVDFNITLRVEAEVDLHDPVVQKALTGPPIMNFSLKK